MTQLPRPILLLLVVGALAACAPAAQDAPTALPTPVPTLTPTTSVEIDAAATLTALALSATPTLTPVPSETPFVITVPATLGESVELPMDITLPAGWRTVSDTLVMKDISNILVPLPFTAFTGPVTGGTASIVVVWGFPSFGEPPEPGTPQGPDLWADGLRLLRLAVVEQGCNIGTDLRRTYRVGLLSGVGTQFSAVDCPETVDTRGWFAGVRESGLSFIFYVYTEPIDAMNVAQDELQAILDTVRFRVPQITATPG
jgi:hypothetical protein